MYFSVSTNYSLASDLNPKIRVKRLFMLKVKFRNQNIIFQIVKGPIVLEVYIYIYIFFPRISIQVVAPSEFGWQTLGGPYALKVFNESPKRAVTGKKAPFFFVGSLKYVAINRNIIGVRERERERERENTKVAL